LSALKEEDIVRENYLGLVHACRKCGNIYNGEEVFREGIESCRECGSPDGFIGRLIPLRNPLAKGDRGDRRNMERVKILKNPTVDMEIQINSWLEENHGSVKILDIQLVSQGSVGLIALIRYLETKN
jgi:hypothetical protein